MADAESHGSSSMSSDWESVSSETSTSNESDVMEGGEEEHDEEVSQSQHGRGEGEVAGEGEIVGVGEGALKEEFAHLNQYGPNVFSNLLCMSGRESKARCAFVLH